MGIVAGQKLRVSDLTGGVTSGGGGGGSTGGAGGFSAVAADVTVNNSTTFVDSGMALDVVAGATYEVYAWLKYSTLATPDIKFSTTRPSGTTGSWMVLAHGIASTTIAVDIAVGVTAVVEDIATSKKAAGDATGTIIIGALTVGTFTTTTDGTFKIRVAQNTSNASNTILRAGSYLRLTRIA